MHTEVEPNTVADELTARARSQNEATRVLAECRLHEANIPSYCRVMTVDTPDDELLRAWGQRAPRAANILLDRYKRKLERFFVSKVRILDIDDLVQVTLIKTYELYNADFTNPGSMDGDKTTVILAPFRARVFSVARMVLLGYMRDKYRIRILGRDFNAEIDSLAALDPAITRQVSALGKVAWLNSELQKLPVELQTLIELRYIQELSYSEIALMYELPEGTVKSRIASARRIILTERARTKRA